MIPIDFPPITVFTSKLYIYFIGSSTWFCDVYRNVGWKNSAAQKKIGWKKYCFENASFKATHKSYIPSPSTYRVVKI